MKVSSSWQGWRGARRRGGRWMIWSLPAFLLLSSCFLLLASLSASSSYFFCFSSILASMALSLLYFSLRVFWKYFSCSSTTLLSLSISFLYCSSFPWAKPSCPDWLLLRVYSCWPLKPLLWTASRELQWLAPTALKSMSLSRVTIQLHFSSTDWKLRWQLFSQSILREEVGMLSSFLRKLLQSLSPASSVHSLSDCLELSWKMSRQDLVSTTHFSSHPFRNWPRLQPTPSRISPSFTYFCQALTIISNNYICLCSGTNHCSASFCSWASLALPRMARQTRQRPSAMEKTSVTSSQVFLQGALMPRMVQKTIDLRRGRPQSIFQPRGALLGMQNSFGEGSPFMMARVPKGMDAVTATSRQKTLMTIIKIRATANSHLSDKYSWAWGITTAQKGQKDMARAMQNSQQRQGPRQVMSQVVTWRLTSTVIRIVETKQMMEAMTSEARGVFLIVSSCCLTYLRRLSRSALRLSIQSYSQRIAPSGTSSPFLARSGKTAPPFPCLRHPIQTSQNGRGSLPSRLSSSFLLSTQGPHTTMLSLQQRQNLRSLGAL